jgi:hypothetical protein
MIRALFFIAFCTLVGDVQGGTAPPNFDVILHFAIYTDTIGNPLRVSYADVVDKLTAKGVNVSDYFERNEAMLLERYGLNYTGLPTNTTEGMPYKTIPGVASYYPLVFDRLNHTLVNEKGARIPNNRLVQTEFIITLVNIFETGNNFSGSYGGTK